MNAPLIRLGQFTCSLQEWESGARKEFSLWTKLPAFVCFVSEAIALCCPQEIWLCEGTKDEQELLYKKLVEKGAFIPLDWKKRPGSYWCHSHVEDVARVEGCTFVCSHSPEDAGPTNNWRDPKEMKQQLLSLFSGCMQGRTLYVVPFCMGPINSPFALIGVEITDSPYVVCNMHLMTRMGLSALEMLVQKGSFIPCMHSVGDPLEIGKSDTFWPCNPKNRYIVHFPEERSIWSFGSGYGGNALLGKKSLALRIASVIAKDEKWLAEHMLLMGVTNPEGKKKYFAAAFPSQCGKTNLALMSSVLPGWKIECIGDDIAWIRKGKDGRFYAINPEAGFFGVAPGTSTRSNAHAMQMISHDTIFTNVALTQDKDVWWEGMTEEVPEDLTSWRGVPYVDSSGPAAHPNARFTVSATQCPILDPCFENPEGVPLAAIIFGGRRSSTVPLVYESFSWEHGVFLGACISSETTAAADGHIGKLRHDPFAMLPFCGYHMGDYFAHWLDMGKDDKNAPLMFYVNWFRKGKDGTFLWPGFGENIRVLEWIFQRTEGEGAFETGPLGYVPSKGALNLEGLSIQEEALFSVPLQEWQAEVSELEKYFLLFEDKMPEALWGELAKLKERIDETAHTKSK